MTVTKPPVRSNRFVLAILSGLGFGSRMNNTTTATIDSRQYTLTEIAIGALVAADMISRNWEPKLWIATGVRGAQFLVMQRKSNGEFVRS
jgi:hypothetical protein